MGDDVTCGLGDHPNSNAYHADITLAYGIKFVWLGRGTMITGQSVPISIKSFINIYDSNHPFYSIMNISKELAKNILSHFGNKKYSMHRNNDLVRITSLDDGQKVYEFMRFDNHWRGVGRNANVEGLAYVISKKNIERLKEVSGFMIVYTHFGQNTDHRKPLPIETIGALRNLAIEYHSGHIDLT